MRTPSASASARRSPRVASPRVLVVLAAVSSMLTTVACGGKVEKAPVTDYKGVLGSCLAKEAYYLQGNKEQVLSSCTEHSYESRGTRDPADSLREDYVSACKAKGFRWSAKGCPPKGMPCEAASESLDAREGLTTHRWRTVWYGEQGFSLASTEHKKLLCPE